MQNFSWTSAHLIKKGMEFLQRFKAKLEISLSFIPSEGKKKSWPLLVNTSQSHTQITDHKERWTALTGILAHVDLLFKNITEALAGIEKV